MNFSNNDLRTTKFHFYRKKIPWVCVIHCGGIAPLLSIVDKIHGITRRLNMPMFLLFYYKQCKLRVYFVMGGHRPTWQWCTCSSIRHRWRLISPPNHQLLNAIFTAYKRHTLHINILTMLEFMINITFACHFKCKRLIIFLHLKYKLNATR